MGFSSEADGVSGAGRPGRFFGSKTLSCPGGLAK